MATKQHGFVSCPGFLTAASMCSRQGLGQYQPFSDVTRNSLQHALAEADVSLDTEGLDNLMAAYDTLTIFPDVSPVFDHLRKNTHIKPVVFSNGTLPMINASLAKSPDLSPHANLFQHIVVVEPVRRFKPAPEVYASLCEQVGKGQGKEKDVWLVSGNPFDVVGANAVGLRTCWVDRSGRGWTDALVAGDRGKPTVTATGVDQVVPQIEAFLKSSGA
jgi:2-haloacid dehalogenase